MHYAVLSDYRLVSSPAGLHTSQQVTKQRQLVNPMVTAEKGGDTRYIFFEGL
jgi:hypothetical protein